MAHSKVPTTPVGAVPKDLVHVGSEVTLKFAPDNQHRVADSSGFTLFLMNLTTEKSTAVLMKIYK